jgi:hypothetical protein
VRVRERPAFDLNPLDDLLDEPDIAGDVQLDDAPARSVR